MSKDKRGGRTYLQERAASLQTTVIELVSHSGKSASENAPAAAALGARLMQILYDDRSDEFKSQTRTYHEQAISLFRGTLPMVGMDIKNFGNEMSGRAKIFEEQRQPKHANFLRTIVCICDAITEPDSRTQLHISRACVKAWYAGGDYEKIKSAAMLLF
jgi:hypothetical protein